MELIYITNDPKLALSVEESGVQRIMVDLEQIGKADRQGHLDTVMSIHSIDDVRKVRSVLSKAKLLVRVNPIHEHSEQEIDNVIEAGANILMLPFFKTKMEVEHFVRYVNGRAIVNLLLETPEALTRIDDILDVEGINEIHVGLNDLHLGMNLDFMFELLSGGIVEYIAKKVKSKGLKFGFGGITRVGKGLLDSQYVLMEHYRLGSEMVILSRDFKDYKESTKDILLSVNLKTEVGKIKDIKSNILKSEPEALFENSKIVKELVAKIVSLKSKK